MKTKEWLEDLCQRILVYVKAKNGIANLIYLEHTSFISEYNASLSKDFKDNVNEHNSYRLRTAIKTMVNDGRLKKYKKGHKPIVYYI